MVCDTLPYGHAPTYQILRVAILSLLYTSMYSDGSSLYPELNPLVERPFKLVCRTEATITNTVTIRFPNGFTAGFCDPPSDRVPADCTGSGSGSTSYSSALNETENTVTISTSILAADANGTWKCTYNSERASYILAAPIRETKDENLTLIPTSFTDNITSETASFSLSATYGCINLPVYFQWFVVDSASKKIDISGTNNAVENSSVCTSLSGFNGYTETKEVNGEVYSSNYSKNLDGSYRLGVEVHYTGEVTTLHSIKYFDTYFVFNPTTTATTEQQKITNATTEQQTITMGTNDGSKDFKINLIIGTVLGACVLIVI